MLSMGLFLEDDYWKAKLRHLFINFIEVNENHQMNHKNQFLEPLPSLMGLRRVLLSKLGQIGKLRSTTGNYMKLYCPS